jgi:hypothetical protein
MVALMLSSPIHGYMIQGTSLVAWCYSLMECVAETL